MAKDTLAKFARQTQLIWFKWLNRRSQKASLSVEQFFERLLKRYRLPAPVAVHSVLRAAKP